MPAYDFQCNSCETIFEERRPFSRAGDPAECPDCGSGETLYHYDRSALYFFPALLEELRAGFDPPPLMFTEDEIEAIVVGLALLGRTRDKGLVRSAGSAAAKIAEVLPEGAQQPAPLRVSRWTRIPDHA